MRGNKCNSVWCEKGCTAGVTERVKRGKEPEAVFVFVLHEARTTKDDP